MQDALPEMLNLFHHPVTALPYLYYVMATFDSTTPTLGYNTAVKQTIFSVEDDADISRLVRHQLETAGYGVRAFPAAGVIADAEKQAPSLFLLDIMLPGGDGLELCRRIRQTPSLAMVPIIFVTAKASESETYRSGTGSG